MGHHASTVKPIGSRILVRPDEAAKTTRGGIIIPDTVREKYANEGRRRFGTVVAMGPGQPLAAGGRWPMPDLKPGDRIMFRDDGAYKILLDTDDEEDVLHMMIRDTFIDCYEDIGETA